MLIFFWKKAQNYAYDMLIFVGKIWYMVPILTQNSKIDWLLLKKAKNCRAAIVAFWKFENFENAWANSSKSRQKIQVKPSVYAKIMLIFSKNWRLYAYKKRVYFVFQWFPILSLGSEVGPRMLVCRQGGG